MIMFFYLEITAIKCPDIPEPQHGSLGTYDVQYNSTAMLYCHDGYNLPGLIRQTTLRCSESGEWTPSLTECIRMYHTVETNIPLHQ